jgi:AMP-binding enzyme C-terminal domain/Phosphopantetheine attachment site
MEDPRAPIGRAIDRTRILILDWCSRPVLPGTVAEIYIEGPNLARGYHRAPGLTAERFVPNPLPRPQPGARVFRTGDLGYRNNQGTIWFRGRADTQVKVRGHRIELEEIRHALLRHPSVADAVVITTGDRDEKRLCAYIVAQDKVDMDNVREFARTLLPVYMVPSLMQTVSSIPTTRNGKVDYATLAVMASPVRTPVSVAKPNGAIQTELLAMWRDLIKNNMEIGPDVDFLQIGGNSILLLQLQLKLRARFGVNVSMGRLALNSSFFGMCCCIREVLDKQGSTGADAIAEKPKLRHYTVSQVATPVSD